MESSPRGFHPIGEQKSSDWRYHLDVGARQSLGPEVFGEVGAILQLAPLDQVRFLRPAAQSILKRFVRCRNAT